MTHKSHFNLADPVHPVDPIAFTRSSTLWVRTPKQNLVIHAQLP